MLDLKQRISIANFVFVGFIRVVMCHNGGVFEAGATACGISLSLKTKIFYQFCIKCCSASINGAVDAQVVQLCRPLFPVSVDVHIPPSHARPAKRPLKVVECTDPTLLLTGWARSERHGRKSGGICPPVNQDVKHTCNTRGDLFAGAIILGFIGLGLR